MQNSLDSVLKLSDFAHCHSGSHDLQFTLWTRPGLRQKHELTILESDMFFNMSLAKYIHGRHYALETGNYAMQLSNDRGDIEE
ncbi:hypothetical protein PABG_11499 [Paracoccidioides brasiliensis Pb03]|uniref:Uncharacterized protein n=1 Tax=Paracoccidioides brasiliensis TaxID=121759 RepID=A0A1D2JBH8_PARBR|nr:hypothetical protein PABG_11499 [Paracoccidioides brasiliensis Pb03]ODH25850.1 hypothetical protein ACO22_05006 [Paracoccidioides brasiliensis]